MADKVTRRDFLNGTRVAIGASLLSPWAQAFGSDVSSFELPHDYYPPNKTGLRGSHDGSWETMHARVAGTTWPRRKAHENYDLVVVGAGISGLSAAHFYREANPGARVLLLDNHDDFGGHAKRNEFELGGRKHIAYGGTESIDTPSSYTEISRQLLVDIGVDVQRFYDYYDQELYDGLDLGYSIAFDEETYGERKVVHGYGSRSWQEFANEAPLTDKARADLVRAFEAPTDYLPGMTRDEKIELLSRISYREYLRDYVKVDEQVLELYQRWGMSYWCVGMDEVPAVYILEYGDGGGLPGLSHTVKREGGPRQRALHFPFPRRQCLDRTITGTQTDTGRVAGQDHGRQRAGATRLRAARPPRCRCTDSSQ